MSKVCIIGTTTWGLTLGVVLTRNQAEVKLWARTPQEAHDLTEASRNGDPHHHLLRLHGATLPKHLSLTGSLEEALREAAAVILAVPSQKMRQNISLIKDYLTET